MFTILLYTYTYTSYKKQHTLELYMFIYIHTYKTISNYAFGVHKSLNFKETIFATLQKHLNLKR